MVDMERGTIVGKVQKGIEGKTKEKHTFKYTLSHERIICLD